MHLPFGHAMRPQCGTYMGLDWKSITMQWLLGTRRRIGADDARRARSRRPRRQPRLTGVADGYALHTTRTGRNGFRGHAAGGEASAVPGSLGLSTAARQPRGLHAAVDRRAVGRLGAADGPLADPGRHLGAAPRVPRCRSQDPGREPGPRLFDRRRRRRARPGRLPQQNGPGPPGGRARRQPLGGGPDPQSARAVAGHAAGRHRGQLRRVRADPADQPAPDRL